MDGDRAKDSDERGITFVPTSGSAIGGMMKEKTARITDAMTDLQLGIDGLRTQLSGANDGKRWARALAAFGRTCSVFLRKTVLGDFGKRGTRLLDDRVLDSTGLRFGRLRRIPRDKRRWIEVGFGLTGGDLKITKLDDHTHEPEATYRFRAGSQSAEFAIEWPLPGAADWAGVPCENSPWLVSPDQLFRTADDPSLSCDRWLGAAGGAGESTFRGGAGDRGRRGAGLPASGRIGGTGREGGEGGSVAGKRRSLPLRRLGHRAEGRVARFGREAGAGSEGRARGGLPIAGRNQGTSRGSRPLHRGRTRHDRRPISCVLEDPERDIGFER